MIEFSLQRVTEVWRWHERSSACQDDNEKREIYEFFGFSDVHFRILCDFRWKCQCEKSPEINKHRKHKESFVCWCNLSLNIPVTWDHCKQNSAFISPNETIRVLHHVRSCGCVCIHTHRALSLSLLPTTSGQKKTRSNSDDWEFIFQSITICNGGDGRKKRFGDEGSLLRYMFTHDI